MMPDPVVGVGSDGHHEYVRTSCGRELTAGRQPSPNANAGRLGGLTLGADDYVTKPFSPTEVVLRVQAVLHRAGRNGGSRARPATGAAACASTRTGTRRSLTAGRWT